MARIQYKPSARSRGFRAQQLSTEGISRMREESNRLIEGMRRRHQAEDEQRERERRALEADQAYQEQITKENNAIELSNLQIEAEREVGGINAKMQQSAIDTQAAMDILGSITDFSTTASKLVAQQQANKIANEIKNLQAQPISIEDKLRAKRAEAQGAIALDAANAEDQIKNNEDPRTSIRANVTNPGRLGPVGRSQTDLNYKTQLPVYISKLSDQQFTAANGKTFTGLDINTNPELVNEFYKTVQDNVLEASGLQAGDMPETMALLEGMRLKAMESALNESYKQDKALLVYQTETLFRSGNLDNIANGFSGASGPLGKAAALDMMDKAIADPNLSEEKREALLNFVLPIEGNTKPYKESHYKSRVKVALDELRENQNKLFDDQEKIRKSEAKKWVLQNSDFIQTEIDNTNNLADLEEKEVQLKELWQDQYPGIEFPSTLTSRFSTAKKGNKVDIRRSIDDKYRNKELDLPFVNNIKDATLKQYAKEKHTAQQVELYGEGYEPLIANIDSLAKSAANFTSTISGDTNGTVEAVRAKMLDFIKNHPLYSLSKTNDANKTNQALKIYVDGAAITDGSNGDPLNPFRYKEGTHGREYLEIGVPDPDKQQHLNWVRKKMTTSQTLGALIQDNPYLIPADKIKEVPKAQEAGQPIIFNDTVYFLAKHYKKKPTEVYNAIVKRRNEVAGTNDPLVTPNDFTELQDNASPEWNKLISSGNFDQVRRAGAQVIGQLPRRASMVQRTGIRGLADLVSGGEGNPTSMFPGENYPEMTNMTIREVVELQKEKLGDGRESAAVGAYQFLYPEIAAQRAGLSLDEKFTPENQLKMFVGTLLNKPGRENLSAFLQGTSNDIETAIDELSQEFASIEYRDGRSYYDDGVNKASISRDQVRAALLSAREELTTQ